MFINQLGDHFLSVVCRCFERSTPFSSYGPWCPEKTNKWKYHIHSQTPLRIIQIKFEIFYHIDTILCISAETAISWWDIHHTLDTLSCGHHCKKWTTKVCKFWGINNLLFQCPTDWTSFGSELVLSESESSCYPITCFFISFCLANPSTQTFNQASLRQSSL